MNHESKYVSKQPDANGYIQYSDLENQTWKKLFEHLIQRIPGHACQEFIDGMHFLDLNEKAIPQLPNVNKKLSAATGWVTHPVPCLIPHDEFFTLLSQKKFPVATFIRTPEEFNYVTEPDVFHEMFGHCSMLAHQDYADFMQAYAELVLNYDEKEFPLLQRFYWFTVEFGLIKTAQGLRAYGGGILSSPEETLYCIDSDIPERHAFDILNIFRMPYRIDILQTNYFVIDSYQQLYDILKQGNLDKLLKKAHELGEFEPNFPIVHTTNIHINYC